MDQATTRGKNNFKWKEVTIGGVSGILLGSVGTFAANAATTLEPEAEEEVVDVTEDEQTEAEETAQAQSTVTAHGNVANGVNDNMSFNEAFAAARSEVGAGGCFVWHGNVYGTYYANEWNAMTPEQQIEFSQMATTGHAPQHTYTAQATSTHSGTTTQQAGTTTGTEQGTGEDDMTVEVLGVEQIQNEDGTTSNIGVAGINGQAVYFIDVDGQDNEFEYMAADANANGRLDDGEFTDISDQHMSVSHFQDLAQASNTGAASGTGNEVEQYYASNENLPDYVNDADPVDLA